MSEKKVCEQCHAEKDIEEFPKHATKYVPSHHMSICKVCYKQNQEERQRQYEARMEEQRRQEEAAREAERQAREQEEQRRQARALELSIQANRRCPRCKQVRTDGELWGEDHLHFSRYCQACTEADPHRIYTLTCPVKGIIRYVGITRQPLSKRLAGHMRSDSGTEHKQQWIDTLRSLGKEARIEMIGEAPNEREAQKQEQEWIDHYLQLGCPLTNVEAQQAQRVLDLQSGRVYQEQERLSIRLTYNNSTASAFRAGGDRARRMHITRWRNRHEQVYVADTSYHPLNHVGSSWFYNEKATLYEHVTYEYALQKTEQNGRHFSIPSPGRSCAGMKPMPPLSPMRCEKISTTSGRCRSPSSVSIEIRQGPV